MEKRLKIEQSSAVIAEERLNSSNELFFSEMCKIYKKMNLYIIRGFVRVI